MKLHIPLNFESEIYDEELEANREITVECIGYTRYADTVDGNATNYFYSWVVVYFDNTGTGTDITHQLTQRQWEQLEGEATKKLKAYK